MNTQYILVGVVAAAIGLSIAGATWIQIASYRADTSNTEPVDATVVSASVAEGRNGEGQTIYSPNVTYRYAYEGTEYTSSSLYAGPGTSSKSRSRAQKIVDRYPRGKDVTAHVNTEDPNSAFLIDEGMPFWYWGGIVLGGLVVLYGVYSTVLGIRGAEPSSAGF